MDDWTHRFVVIGDDVGAEEQKALEERRREEEREKMRQIKLRYIQARTHRGPGLGRLLR